MSQDNLSFVHKEQAEILPENLHGVIKPKKKLDSLTESVTNLMVDYYTAYFKKHDLKPIHDLTTDASLVKNDVRYHTPFIAICLILRMVNSSTGHELAQTLRNTYTAYIEVGCNPYESVSNVLAMFCLGFDEKDVPFIDVVQVAEVTMPISEEGGIV